MRYHTWPDFHLTLTGVLEPRHRAVALENRPEPFRAFALRMTQALAAVFFLVGSAAADEQFSPAQPGVERVIRSRSGAPVVTAQPSPSNEPAPSQPDSGQPKPEAKKEEPKDGKKKEGDGPPEVVTRPTKPDTPPNPEELNVSPNEAGVLRLNFQGQPWPDVIRWLKRVSNKSLDWKELPGGYLNLSTHREYTVDEARDLINRHLLARGYTILIRGEMMTVEKIAELNPAMVPRVSPADLDNREDYEFVKVSFSLSALVAEQAAEELKPMLSTNGKLVPLAKTNRLEAIDSVINLREIRDILTEEQSGDGDERRVWQFALKHVRAEELVTPLYALLGEQRGGSGGGDAMNSSQMQQMQQQMQGQQEQMINMSPPSEDEFRKKLSKK